MKISVVHGVSGSEVRKFMRQNNVKIRELKARMGVTLKYIRRVREHGVSFLGALDFWNGISGQEQLPENLRFLLGMYLQRKEAGVLKEIAHS